jgi:hypothetical protein
VYIEKHQLAFARMMSENKIRKNARTLPSVAGFSIIAVLLVAAVVMTPGANNLLAAGQQPQQDQIQNSQGQQGGQSTTANVTTPAVSTTSPGSVLRLSNANIEMDIPMMRGYENGNEIFSIATDASDNQTATQITNATGFKVNFAPLLADTPENATGKAYIFENGIEGEGLPGFQLPVINARPGQEGYSPLVQINHVTWNEGAQPTELRSEQDIIAASDAGQLSIEATDIIVNQPAVQWQDGSLAIREDAGNITDESPYMGGGQVTNIDTENMTATFVAHRGWGPDGKTVYYIVTDAVPEMPANMMGVSFVPADFNLVGTPAAPDLFQFMNGINGTGPMGFQAGIGAANADDENYSPMWRISFIEWNDPSQAKILENQNDINTMVQEGLITITPAEEGRHIVNCPFFDEETVFEHQKGSS